MNDHVMGQAEYWRSGGKWMIRITGPQWIMDDINRDREGADLRVLNFGGSLRDGHGMLIKVEVKDSNLEYK